MFSSFARAFESPPNQVANLDAIKELQSGDTKVESQENFVFEVSLEIREDDGKSHYVATPRDKGFFKLRSCIPKQIWLTIYQIPDAAMDLNVERCFGLLLSPGRHVRHSDMQVNSMSHVSLNFCQLLSTNAFREKSFKNPCSWLR